MQGDLLRWVEDLIREHPQGRFPGDPLRSLFEGPLLGVASGDDPLFAQYKAIIGSFHQLPSEALEMAFPGESFSREPVSVVAYVLPLHERTRLANRRQRRFPHRDWMLTKIHGELFNEFLRRELARSIRKLGYRAVAPVLHSSFLQFPRPDGEITSNWSERHACFAAGLGTFGLSDGLITPKGQAMRCGSVIAKMKIPPTPRPYKDHHAYCLFYSHWQGLNPANGVGWSAFQTLVARVQKHLRDQVIWMRPSEYTDTLL